MTHVYGVDLPSHNILILPEPMQWFFLATTSVPGGFVCWTFVMCLSLGKLSKYQITYIVSNPTTLMFVERTVYLEMPQLVGLETIRLFPSNDWGFSPIESCPLCTFLGFSVLPQKNCTARMHRCKQRWFLRFPFGFDLVCTQVIQVDTSETREALLVFVGDGNAGRKSTLPLQPERSIGSWILWKAQAELGIKVPNLAYFTYNNCNHITGYTGYYSG